MTLELLAEQVAHEINNPLACVQANLSSLARYASKIAAYAEHVAGGEPLFARQEDDEAQRFFERMHQLREELKLDFVLGDLADLIEQSLCELGRAQQVVQRLGSLARPAVACPAEGDRLTELHRSDRLDLHSRPRSSTVRRGTRRARRGRM